MNQFDAQVRAETDMAVLDLTGTIDSGAEPALDAAYRACAELEAGAVALDFTKVDYINSTGIALIVGVLASARKNGHSVTACGLADHYREIFEITRLADFMTITDKE